MLCLSHDHRVFGFSRVARAAVRVAPGSTVAVETADCFADQLGTKGEGPGGIDWTRVNPATGPLHIQGALPGDTLSVFVESIALASQGIMGVGPDFGVFRAQTAGTEFAVVPLREGTAILPGGISVPIRPMIGVIGVAPPGNDVPCGLPGPHGGNLDTRLIEEGSTVLLPVFAPGGLLAVGDLHAAMGDGEVCGTGVEVAGRVQLRLELRRDLVLANPLLKTSAGLVTIASAESLDDAADRAARDMVGLLTSRLRLSLKDASMILSATGHLQVSQIVNPLKTARFVLPIEVVQQLGDVV